MAIVAGAFLTPVLLPFIPFRSFGVKGWIVGLAITVIGERVLGPFPFDSRSLLATTYLFFPAASSYIALQFTGSTTYTGMSGVNRELRIGLPLYIGAVCLSAVLLVLFKLAEWRVV